MSKHFEYVESGKDYIESKNSSRTLFGVRKDFRGLASAAINGAVLSLFEKWFGQEVYFKVKPKVTDDIDGDIQATIGDLINDKVVASWCERYLEPGLPEIFHFALQLAPIKNSEDSKVVLANGVGEGSGFTARQALVSAVAETIERYETVDIRGKSLVPYTNLQPDQCIANVYPFITRHDVPVILEDYMWTPAKSLLGETCYLPAKAVYIDFNHPGDIGATFELTTNGVAAGLDAKRAKTAAVLEAVERHELMAAWLLNKQPVSIDLHSIPKEVGSVFIDLCELGIDCRVLKLTGDLGIPTYCAVATRNTGCRKVIISAVSDFESDHALKKLSRELLKHLHMQADDVVVGREAWSLEDADLDGFDFSTIQTYLQRDYLTRNAGLISYAQPFLQGEVQAYRPEVVRHNSSELNMLTKILLENNIDGYFVELDGKVSRKYGLSVYRFVSPQLVPIFFNQQLLPAITKHYFQEYAEDAINKCPIPFL